MFRLLTTPEKFQLQCCGSRCMEGGYCIETRYKAKTSFCVPSYHRDFVVPLYNCATVKSVHFKKTVHTT